LLLWASITFSHQECHNYAWGYKLTMLHMLDMLYPGLFKRILWHSQKCHHSQNNVAKFGYVLDMKVEKKKNPSIFPDPHWNLIIKTGDLKKKPFKIWANLNHFFLWKILCIGWNYINTVVLLTLHKPGPLSSSSMFLVGSRKLCSGN